MAFMDAPPTSSNSGTSSMNSGLGRFALFSLTILLFCLSCTGLALWSTPGDYGKGVSFIFCLLTVFCCTSYLSLPILAEVSGIGIFDANWKPYAHLYRLSFLTGIPALILVSMGFGAQVMAGEYLTEKRKTFPEILEAAGGDMNNKIGATFALDDLFVALNQTKAVVKTLNIDRGMVDVSWENSFNPQVTSISAGKSTAVFRYSTRKQVRDGVTFFKPTHLKDVQYHEESDPLVGAPAPLPSDRKGHIVFAPIFSKWNLCLTRFSVPRNCMEANPLLGFAYKYTDTWCDRAGMLGCRTPKPRLNPIYRCQTEKINGAKYGNYMQGLCGRIAKTPELIELEEVIWRHIQDEWKLGTSMACSCPKADKSALVCPDEEACKGVTVKRCADCPAKPVNLFFVNVDDDPCIGDYARCAREWGQKQVAGLLLASLTVILITTTLFMDFYVDRYLRAAAKYIG